MDLPKTDLVTRAHLLDVGYSAGEIKRERSAGRLTRIRRGIYSPDAEFAHLPVESRHALAARAAAVAAPAVVVSHISAAVLHGLPVRDVAMNKVHVTRQGAGGGRNGLDSVLHVGSFTESDLVEIAGVRTTSLARTLVDLARIEAFEAGVIAADNALHRYPGVVDEVAEALTRARHQPGATAARRTLRFADGRSESVGESRFRVFCHHAGLPVPELQCKVCDGSGAFVGRTDGGYLDDGLLIEFDGMAKYGRLRVPGRNPLDILAEEKEREDALRGLGWQIVRVTWPELNNPAALAARVQTMLARGRRALAANAIMGTVRPLNPIQLPR